MSSPDVGPGPARITQVAPPRWVATAPATAGDVVVTSGLSVADRDLGVVEISLDVDGNGRADALTDGRLIYRALNGVTDAQLVAGSVLAGDARRTRPETILGPS